MDVSAGGGDRGGGGRGAQGGNHQVLRSPSRGRTQGEVRQKLEKDLKLKGVSKQMPKGKSNGIFDPRCTALSSIHFHAEK